MSIKDKMQFENYIPKFSEYQQMVKEGFVGDMWNKSKAYLTGDDFDSERNRKYPKEAYFTLKYVPPKDITEFNGLPTRNIKTCNSIDFSNCRMLTSVSNLPHHIKEDLNFSFCTSLISVVDFPEYVGGRIIVDGCPFFEGMDEEQIRQKYNISE